MPRPAPLEEAQRHTPNLRAHVRRPPPRGAGGAPGVPPISSSTPLPLWHRAALTCACRRPTNPALPLTPDRVAPCRGLARSRHRLEPLPLLRGRAQQARPAPLRLPCHTGVTLMYVVTVRTRPQNRSASTAAAKVGNGAPATFTLPAEFRAAARRFCNTAACAASCCQRTRHSGCASPRPRLPCRSTLLPGHAPTPAQQSHSSQCTTTKRTRKTGAQGRRQRLAHSRVAGLAG